MISMVLTKWVIEVVVVVSPVMNKNVHNTLLQKNGNKSSAEA